MKRKHPPRGARWCAYGRHYVDRFDRGATGYCYKCQAAYQRDWRERKLGKPPHRNNAAPAGMRWCRKCDRLKPHGDFYFNNSRGVWYSYCRPCEKERQAELRRQRKLKETT